MVFMRFVYHSSNFVRSNYSHLQLLPSLVLPRLGQIRHCTGFDGAPGGSNALKPSSPDAIEKTLSLLYGQGFSSRQIDDILHLYPDIVKCPAKDVSDSVGGWLSCKFGEERTLQDLASMPHLLNCPSSVVSNRRWRLSAVFRKDHLYRLFSLAPNVFVDKWPVTEAKIEYLFDEMGVSAVAIAKQGVLKHSLQHIRLRHMFLVKAGLYNKEQSMDDRSKKMKMSNIFDTSDEEFCSKLPGLSLLEYEAFSEMVENTDIDEKDYESD